jgi:hypothetical protein
MNPRTPIRPRTNARPGTAFEYPQRHPKPTPIAGILAPQPPKAHHCSLRPGPAAIAPTRAAT